MFDDCHLVDQVYLILFKNHVHIPTSIIWYKWKENLNVPKFYDVEINNRSIKKKSNYQFLKTLKFHFLLQRCFRKPELFYMGNKVGFMVNTLVNCKTALIQMKIIV